MTNIDKKVFAIKKIRNIDDVPAFVAGHLQSAPHHNYTVGAAILRKRA